MRCRINILAPLLGGVLGAAISCGCPEDTALTEGTWVISRDPASRPTPPALFTEDGVNWEDVEILAENDTLVFEYETPPTTRRRVTYDVSTVRRSGDCE
jgi:hypothetical protein